jgi:hypothetical protein
MKKKLLLICLLIAHALSFGQDLGGFTTSPYAGVQSVNLQPASLASLPYTIDANLIGLSASVFVKDFLPQTDLSDPLYQGDNLSFKAMMSTDQRNFFVNANVMMPSVAVRLNEKSGLAFTWRFRVTSYGVVSNSSLSVLAQNEFEAANLGEFTKVDKILGVANTWEEFGLSYGRTMYNKKRHKIDVGISAKYLVGGASGFIEVEGLKVDYDIETNSLNNVSGSLAMNYNNQLDELSEGKSTTLFTSNGFGLNLGVNYEYKSAKYLDKTADRVNQPNYLFKVSTSLRDVGKIFFKSSDNSGTYALKQSTPVNADFFANTESISDFQTKIEKNFNLEKRDLGNYELRLPTTLNMNIDWNLWRNFYANSYLDVTGVEMRKSFFQSQMLLHYKFIGRFEKAKYGFYTSFDYNKYSKWGSSLSFRYSILYVGVKNFIHLSKEKTTQSLGLMFALKIPILSKSETKKGRVF